jgi:tRNA (guanine-N7-)-methyltransferase
MSKKGKQEKFVEIGTLPNVFQNHEVLTNNLVNSEGKKVNMQGHWHEFFGNDNPITVELACGKGEYAVGLARMYPERNFIGMDLKGNRLWRGATAAIQEGLTNVAFIRSQIDFISYYFAPGELSEIWITFADPQLEKPRKRLTSNFFMDWYRQVLKPGGLIHLKTDSPELYEFTLARVKEEKLKLQFAHDNIYILSEQMLEWDIKTYYEQMHLEKGLTIKYLRFEL